jgi:hypothetical protein
MDLVLLIGQSNAKGDGELYRNGIDPLYGSVEYAWGEIAENIVNYYNDGKKPVLEETDDLVQARRFLEILEGRVENE